MYITMNNHTLQVQKAIKIAKTNFVLMKLLSGGHKQDSQVTYTGCI